MNNNVDNDKLIEKLDKIRKSLDYCRKKLSYLMNAPKPYMNYLPSVDDIGDMLDAEARHKSSFDFYVFFSYFIYNFF
jgi:hypothetical protein